MRGQDVEFLTFVAEISCWVSELCIVSCAVFGDF